MARRINPAARKRHSGTHLAEDELLPSADTCPICQGDRAAADPGVSIQDAPDVRFLECPRCHGLSASRMPTPATIDRLYREFYVGDEDAYTFHDPSRLARHILRVLRPWPDGSRIRVLEIGGGDGTLLRTLARELRAGDESLEVDACEVELFEGEDEETDGFRMRFFRSVEKLDGRFDLVLANACLHQIPDLGSVLRPAFASLRPGGLFFASTAFVSPLARLLGHRVDTLFPLHVHDLGPGFWHALPATFGLNARLLRSGPSIVETDLGSAPLRTLAAQALKLPGRIERALRRPVYTPRWIWVGGWEVFYEIGGSA
jgi:SAM-dependent methyltransferase